MIVTAIVLLVAVALLDSFIGIKEPWRKVIYVALVIFLIIAFVLFLAPGVLRF